MIVPVVFWSLGSTLGWLLNVSVVLWFALAGAFAAAYVVAAAIAGESSKPAAAVIAVWLGLPIVILLFGIEPHQLLWTYVIPLLVGGFLAFGLSRLRLRDARDLIRALAAVPRTAPYVAPVVLVAVLLPALTADVWQLAAEVSLANLFGAGVLSVGILILFVRRQLGSELGPVLAARCRDLATRATTPANTRRSVISAVDADTARIASELPDERFTEAWRNASDEYAPYLAATEAATLRQPLTTRLVLTVAIIAALLATYIYALLAVTVPESVATSWAASAIPRYEVPLAITTISLPGGPYLGMSALLGVFATAIFLAFVLTEEKIAAAVTDALLRDPIERFLTLALPYVVLIERSIESAADFYLPDVEEPSSASTGGALSK